MTPKLYHTIPVWLLCRLLESQLQSQKRSHENEAEVLRGEIQSLKEENNRQQQLLAQNLQLPPEARIEASLQHEITRLTNENLVSLWTPTFCNGSIQPSTELLKLLSSKYSLSHIHYYPTLEEKV